MSFTLCSQPALSKLLYLTLPQSSLLSQERRLGTSQLLYIIFPRHGLFLFSLSSLSLSSYCPQFTFLIKTGRGRIVNFSQFSKEGGKGVSKKFCVNQGDMKIFRLFKKYPPRFPLSPPPTSRPFFGKPRNAIRGQNLLVPHFAHYLSKPWTDGFVYVNGRQGW